MEDNLEEVHEELLSWAQAVGIEINSIRPMRISGRGFGIVATDRISLGAEILTVPCSRLRTKDTVKPAIIETLPKDMAIHGLLAAELALNQIDNKTKYSEWTNVIPTWDDMQLSMPLTWPASLQSSLPTAAAKLLQAQQKKFEKDWAIVAAALPFPKKGGIETTCTKDEYLYAWLLVNTRTFYFVTPKTRKLPKEDHMVLQPVADLFNHTDKDGCDVRFDHETSYSFVTQRSYEKGDEVHIGYGNHSNDFLLVEYGFVLDQNAWDEISLDDVILPELSEAQQEDLEDVGFLGNYTLDKETACYRTQVALRLLLTDTHHGLSIDDWHQFVSGFDDGEKSQRRVNAVLVALLKDFESKISDKTKELKKIKFGGENKNMDESRRDLLLKRWGQVRNLAKNSIKRLK